MNPIDQAAALLWPHWLAGTRLAALPAQCRPENRTSGYAVQAALARESGQPVVGWKIAATSINGQRHIGVDGPLAGRILAERVIENGGSFQLGTSLMRVAELEFAFRMGRDLPPRAAEYTQDEVLSAVATLHPAIELPDSRFAHFETAGLAQLVADNACAHYFLLGAAADDSWRALDLAAYPGKAYRGGVLAEEGVGANVLGDPRIALTWLVNELSRHGMTLKAGQVVTTGTCVKPVVIAVGDHIEGDLGVLGRVDVRIV
jgi:2-keto-4-pentenoate hydratase